MIRVLHIIDRLKKVSGIARSILNYYEHINTSVLQFDFLVVEYDQDIVNNVRFKGGQVYTIDKLGFRNGFQVKKQIENFFSKHKGIYKIIHSSFYHIDFILFPIAKRYGVKACISHSHNTRYSDYCLRSIRNAILCKLSKLNATHYVACSEMAATFQFGKKITRCKDVLILKNAIDVQKYSYNPIERKRMRELLGISDKYVIGNVGRFNKQKNHAFLIDVFTEYLRIDPDAILLLIGEGELLDHFKEEVRQRGISAHIIFLGARDDVPSLLQAMDCYVFPSLYEGLGIALVEAQAAGLPCIASSVIPIESKTTDNIVYLNFDVKEKWINRIKQYRSFTRKETINEIEVAGYDIVSAVKTLEKYYISLTMKEIC